MKQKTITAPTPNFDLCPRPYLERILEITVNLSAKSVFSQSTMIGIRGDTPFIPTFCCCIQKCYLSKAGPLAEPILLTQRDVLVALPVDAGKRS